MFDHATQQPSSVTKFLCDVYSSPDTSGLLYTNDARVLIDVIVGQLSDLGPGDAVRVSAAFPPHHVIAIECFQGRTDCLSLSELIIRNSDYAQHRHRLADLHRCFRRIHADDDNADDASQALQRDKSIVEKIWSDFSDLFPR